YTYFVEKGRPYHTFLKQVCEGNFTTLENLIESFNVEKVTEEFFEAYKFALREKLIKEALSRYDLPYKKKYSFSQLLLSRIMFLYFLQKKGWLKWKDYVPDKSYLKNLWFKYKKWSKENNIKDLFYSQWLSSLFFGAFNKRTHLIHPDLPEDIKESFSIMPFLNGGLFSRTELDNIGFDLSDDIFEWLFETDSSDLKKGFLEIYNFTIDETLPIDVEVAVDPEMLGKVYESLIAEEERGETGIFYTPRVEIDFMCRISLVEYLSNETEVAKEKIIDFIFNPHESISNLSDDEARAIKIKLDEVKIVDPAVGSASFLVGMMNILVELHQELTKKLENREENLFALKQKIILENLYGVDVKDWAVMVGELRLWLSL
ncbi:DNA methyltransferase, partial [Caldisericum exile]